MTAYDYDTQRWVEGVDAIPVLLKQAHETLDCIDNPAYQRRLGYTRQQADRIKSEWQLVIRQLT